MVSIKSSFLYNRRPAPSLFIFIFVLVYAILFSGCSRSRHTVQAQPVIIYDFAGATLGVDAPIAPPPSIITNSERDIAGVFRGSAESIFKATTAVVKESQAKKARRRIKQAAEQVDVSLLIADGVLKRSERYLPFIPAEKHEQPDFILLVRVNKHGIYSGPAYDGRTEFFLDAYFELIDDYTGNTVCGRGISIREPISDHMLFSNIFTSKELSEMSEEEMADAMERISDYTADTIVQGLRRELAMTRSGRGR